LPSPRSDWLAEYERKRERECERCGAKRWPLFVIWYWTPSLSEWRKEQRPQGYHRARRRCWKLGVIIAAGLVLAVILE
jgi:hypothetical protein